MMHTPQFIQTQALKPKVYLAGKIRKSCWRHGLIDGLRDHKWDDGPLDQPGFRYVGPFFVSCDHGCYHTESSHGNGTGSGTVCNPEFEMHQREVSSLCRDALDRSDLVFCYIDAPDCYGTIAEIERAHGKGIPVVITFAPGIASETNNQFWFVATDARWVIYDVKEAQLPELLGNALRRYTCL